MTTWRVTSCTVADAAPLAYNNMSAFWEDPNWVIAWPKGIELDYLIEQSTKRQPRNLLRDRESIRHQKAVDPATGKLVGYARWILPDGKGGEKVWEEALVPDVSPVEKEKFEQEAKSAWWGAGEAAPDMDDLNQVVIKRILSEKPYISK
jgi:hypothetical protein